MGQDDVVELARWREKQRRERRGAAVRDSASPLEGVARGEPGAVEACVDAYGPLVRALATRMLPEGADIDDVVQDVFVEVWRSAARFDADRASDRGFVATITRRRIIDRRRRMDRRPRTVRLAPGIECADETFERTIGRVEAAGAVAALRHLSDDRRRWIVMSVVECYTHAEIAEVTKTPLGTIKSGIRRGLAHMRTLLDPPETQREAGR